MAVERDPVRPRALAQAAWPEHFALLRRAVSVDPQPRNAAACGFHDVQELLFRIEANLVGEAKPVGHDAKRPVFITRNVPVGQIGPQRMHPVFQLGGNGDPDSIFRVSQHEVHFADRLAVNGVGEHSGLSVPCHEFQAIGAEIRDQKVAVRRKGQPVRQRAFEIARGFTASALKMPGTALRDNLLVSVRLYADHATTRVSRPQRTVGFREDALRPLEITADEMNGIPVELELEDGIRLHANPATRSGRAMRTQRRRAPAAEQAAHRQRDGERRWLRWRSRRRTDAR